MTTKTITKTQGRTREQVIPYEVITRNELMRKLRLVNGATFAQIHTTTEPAMNKTGNPFTGEKKVIKESTSNTMIDFDYTNNVNNQRIREAIESAKENSVNSDILKFLLPDDKQLKQIAKNVTPKFAAKPRKWGKHMKNETGFLYVEMVKTDKKDENEKFIYIPTGKSWICSRILIDHTKDGEYKIYVQVRVLNTEKPVYKYKETGKILSDNDVDLLKTFLKKPYKSNTQDVQQEIILRDYEIKNIKKIHLNKSRYVVID